MCGSVRCFNCTYAVFLPVEYLYWQRGNSVHRYPETDHRRRKGDATYREILMEIRMPRAFGTVILGGALALSGYLLQTFFHNPIASPFTLGISSGAKLIVALTMVVSLGYAVQLSSWMLIMAAFAGSMLCMGFVLLTARVIDRCPC